MGLLDDAIREHIELKRRHGANSHELARLENEAFGPARSGEHESPASTATLPAEDAAHKPHDEAAHDSHPAEAAPTQLHAVEHPHLSEEPAPHGDPADALGHAEAHPVEPPPPAPARPRASAPEEPIVHEPPPPATSQPTREFDPDEVRAATGEAQQESAPAERAEEGEPADEDGDVLEETPEFLQETPEHDRLWFEQRPPRDFDF